MDKTSEILELLKQLNDKVDKLAAGALFVPEKSVLFFDWLSEWLEIVHRPNVSDSTFEKDRGLLVNHVFGKSQYNKPLASFKLADLNALIASITFPRQKQIASNLVTAALRVAYGNDLMSKDITVNFKKPSHDYSPDRALTHIEERRLFRLLHGFFLETYLKVLLYAGLRRNEALGLMRKDIDFEHDELHVERQVTLKNELTSKLKTKGSRRVVKLFPALRAELLQFEWCAPDVRLFDFNPYYVTHRFSSFCAVNDFASLSLKSLRATFATRCKEFGIPDVIIQSWLGHTSVATTKKHYIKVNPEYVDIEFRKALEKL